MLCVFEFLVITNNWGYSSVSEWVLSVQEASGSIVNTNPSIRNAWIHAAVHDPLGLLGHLRKGGDSTDGWGKSMFWKKTWYLWCLKGGHPFLPLP